MKISRIALAAGLLAASFSVSADYFGTLSGRSANPANGPKLSVEGSFTTSGDYQNLGARINYGVNESLTIYGDFGLSENIGDGNSFGAGIFYHIPDMSDGLDVAIQASYHTATLDFGFSRDTDWTALGAAILVSPKQAMNPNTGLNWYANAGFTNLSIEIPFGRFFVASDDSFEIQLGGGIYMPAGPGTFYAGADFLDEFIIGAGYRFGIQ
ncbi:MAG: hypothetical protein AB8B64_24360 [Granulosicoccus sp.]